MKKYSGFTLIELIITIAVVGILFAMAAPNLQTSIKNNRLSTQYNDMRGDFAFARDLAISRNFAVTISSANGTDWSQGWTVVGPNGAARITTPENNLAINASVSSITYRPDGTAVVTASTPIRICDDRSGNFGKQLNINLAGRVNLTKDVTCP